MSAMSGSSLIDIEWKAEYPIMKTVLAGSPLMAWTRGKASNTPDGTSAAGGSHRPGKSGMIIAGLALVTLLGGCENFSKRHFTVGSVPQDYRTKHPIVISEKEQTMDIPVATGSFALPVADRSAVSGFSRLFKKSASGSIRVLVPSGSANEGAARQVAVEVIKELRKSGVSRGRIIMAPYYAGDHNSSAPIRLSYMAIKAGVDGCGQWPTDLAAGSENRNYHNFGCATQNNLAEMVANPSDLLGPRGSTPIDAERRLKVIEAYRNAENPSTVYEAAE